MTLHFGPEGHDVRYFLVECFPFFKLCEGNLNKTWQKNMVKTLLTDVHIAMLLLTFI